MANLFGDPPTGGQGFWNFVRDLGAAVNALLETTSETLPVPVLVSWPRSETIAAGATVEASYSLTIPNGTQPVALLAEESVDEFGKLRCVGSASGTEVVTISLTNTATVGKAVNAGSTRVLINFAGSND